MVGEQPKELLVEERSLLSIADENAGGSFVTSVEPKGKIEAYEQQAADAKEYAVKVYDGILAMMDENLNSTASTGKSTVIYYKTVDVPQVHFIDEVVDMKTVSQRQVPVIQKVLKIVEVPQVQSIGKIVDVLVVAQRLVPIVPTVQKTMEVSQSQFLD